MSILDFLIPYAVFAAVFAVFALIAWTTTPSGPWHKRERRDFARLFFFAPLWPLVLVALAVRGLRRMARDAFGKDSK